MTLEEDIAVIAKQEDLLQFEKFDEATAWEVGSRIHAEALRQKLSVEIDITLGDHRVFGCAMVGTTPNNADWIRRKKNVVSRFHRSSYGLGRQLEKEGASLESKYGLPAKDYAAAGGCFPIRLRDIGFVGMITVSGLPQREDHKLVVAVVGTFLGISADKLRLD
jgi:uncharacterized protein (UPF0303 family)